MEYNLQKLTQTKKSFWQTLRELAPFLSGQWINLSFSLFAVLINSGITIVGPFIIGDITDRYIPEADKDGLVAAALLLFGFYVVAFIANYLQILVMGRVGQEVLYALRNKIFSVLQSLPLSFFNRNKSGDLISRINNDTDKLNQAFSEILLRLIGNIFIIIGIGVVVLVDEPRLGVWVIGLAAVLLIATRFVTPWINRVNKESLKALGNLSGEIREDIGNFKVIVAFGQRSYFTEKFKTYNAANKQAATRAGIANGILTPIYEFFGYAATLIILVIGLDLLQQREIAFGTLISYLLYTERFFQPLRILASLFASLQTSLAAWSRVSVLLNLQSNLPVMEGNAQKNDKKHVIVFDHVSFCYEKDQYVLKDLHFALETGKTYALVGPTGGGKSTTASLIARLFDPTEGTIELQNRDIRSYTREEIAQKVGFILQDPFLFTSTIGENIVYGNPDFENYDAKKLQKILNEKGLGKVLERFPQGLETRISDEGNSISLGQKQLVAFLRAIIREPEILILDEATANVDTVTETYLEKIITALPKATTKIIIAHRLNTIEQADHIFFIANGSMEPAVDFKTAVHMIQNTERDS